MKTFDTVAKLKLAKLNPGQFVETGGYYTKGDAGGAKYLVVAPQAFDGYGDHELANGNVAVLQISESVNVKKFGAIPGVASQQHDALNHAITASAGNYKLYITPSPNGSQDYQVESTVFMQLDDLDIEFTGGSYLKPKDSSILQPLIIGSNDGSSPSRMFITNPSVQRPSTDTGTANFGILFKRFNQSTITNPEGRFCKYPLAWNPSTGGNEYNTYINPQAVGGERNFWIEATSIGYVNENVFLGGRGFGTPDLETNLYLGGSGLGTGHNRFYGVSLESSYGVQAIWDNGDANEFLQCRTENGPGWTSGFSHVGGSGNQYSMIMTSRIDYDIDLSAAADPRAQIISYKNGSTFETAINGLTTQTLKNQSASGGSGQDIKSNLDNEASWALRVMRLSDDLVRASITTNGVFSGRAFRAASGGYNFNPFQLGSDYFWIDGNHFRHHGAVPSSATAGRIMMEAQESVSVGLGNSANVVNTTDKYKGKMVWDDSSKRPVWALGSAATDDWVYSDGTVAYAP